MCQYHLTVITHIHTHTWLIPYHTLRDLLIQIWQHAYVVPEFRPCLTLSTKIIDGFSLGNACMFGAKLQKVCILGWGVVREWKYEVGEAMV